VSLANNHALDFGEFGLEDTLHYLERAGLTAFGSPFNENRLATQALAGEKKLCFVGYHELFRRDPTKVLEKIKNIEPTCDHTTVFAHWGEEYEHEPTASQRELAHAFVDAGADLVIGAHPHVVQPLEVYNNTAIFYSLGNFVFDQGWRAEVRRGVMVSVEFVGKTERFTLVPVNTYQQVSLAEGAVAEAVFADLGVSSSIFVLENR
jgi:poly-gamma-glutamate synthesis protein (capsule biosynthesis protein)